MQRRIRLLQIGKYFFPDQGGVETVTQAVSDALWPMDIQADVLCFSQRKQYPQLDLPYRILRAKTDFRLSNKSFSVDYVRQIAALAPHYDIGLLHVPNPIGMLGVLRSWNKPLLLLWHADITTYPMLGGVLRGLERKLVAKCARAVVPTNAHVTGSYLARELATKAAVIPFPFDRNRLPRDNTAGGQGAVRVHSFAGSRRIVLAVGRLVGYKGFDVLISAAERLREDLCVVIAGAGPLADELRAQVERQRVGAKVLLLGSVGDADLSALYEAAHLVAMPSVTRAEMYGVTQVEAMSFGRPVVSTRIPGSGVSQVNLHGETGLVVQPRDPDALAEALNHLASDPDLYARLSKGALRAIEETHDLRSAGAKWASTIHEVLATTPREGQP